VVPEIPFSFCCEQYGRLLHTLKYFSIPPCLVTYKYITFLTCKLLNSTPLHSICYMLYTGMILVLHDGFLHFLLLFLISFNNLKDTINAKYAILFYFQYMSLCTLILHDVSQQVPKCIPPPWVLNFIAYSPWQKKNWDLKINCLTFLF
jgi:hypothetical protein